MKKNDFTLSPFEQSVVREFADRLLREAKAYGVFPTPVKQLVRAAGLQVAYLNELIGPNEDAPERVKRALGKLEGFLHRPDRTIFIDRAMKPARKKFISIHEIAHDFLESHRALFDIMEDSEFELNEDTRDLFEREADCFASDVLFQLDLFTQEARSCAFGIGAPVKILSKRYGTGCYSTIRRYVQKCGRPAAVLVCEQPVNGALGVRRFVPSDSFIEEVGDISWPEVLPKDSWFAMNRPYYRFMVPTPWSLINSQFETKHCLVEAYDSTRQIFFFIYPVAARF